MIYNLNVSASYDKIARIKYDVAKAVEKQWKPMKEYTFNPKFPRHILFTLLLITHLQTDTADGKQQLHGTAMTIYQQRMTQKEREKLR